MAVVIQLRRGTAAEWTAANPVLAEGEIGIETDAVDERFKIGNGVDTWSVLPYFSDTVAHEAAANPHPTYETSAEAQAKVDAHTGDASAAHAASAVSFTPTGTVAATDVQAAIAEVASEAGAAHPDLATHDALGLATDAELTTHAADTTAVHGITDTSVLATDAEVATAISDHEAAGNPHPTYETASEVDARIATHAGAADPHPVYETSAEAQAKVDAHTSDATDAHDASAVSFAPAGTIAATNVQAAIEEVASEAGGSHPDLAAHDTLGLATQAELDAHAAAADPHTGYTTTAEAQALVDTHTADTADAHDASAVSFVPAGTIAATNVQAAIEEVASEAGGAVSVYRKSLATTFAVADHIATTVVIKGVFVPNSSSVEVEVGINGFLLGIAHINPFFAWNQTVAAGAEIRTGQSGTNAWVANTSYKSIGSFDHPSFGAASGVTRRFQITGLTPGVATTWQLVVGALGYYEETILTPVGSHLPLDIVFSPDQETVYVSVFWEARVRKYTAGDEMVKPEGFAQLIGDLHGHVGAYGLAQHPTDPTILYIARNGSNEVVEVDLERNVVLRSFAVTAPYWLAILPDASKLYVVRQAADGIVPITLATGSVGSLIATNDQPMRPVIVGTDLYVPCTGANSVQKISTTTDTVTATLSLGAGNAPQALTAIPDGSALWVAEHTTARCREIVLPGFTLSGAQVDTTGGNPFDVASSPTGKSLVVVGEGSYRFWSFALPPLGIYHDRVTSAWVPELTRIAIDEGGDLYVIGDDGTLGHWQGVRMDVNPADDIWGSYADVAVYDAVAGTGD